MTVGRFDIQPLAGHDRTSFSCGVKALDRYFLQQIGQDRDRGLTRPFLLIDTSTAVVAGFYTLSSCVIDISSLPEEYQKKTRAYPAVPAILLGRLAIDRQYQGQQLGQVLLMDALRRCQEATQQVGAWAVVVDAKDDSARGFYEHYDFRRVIDSEFRLFLPMSSIQKLNL